MAGLPFQVLFKVVLTGDSGVGKTKLLQRYVHNEFHLDGSSTVGIEFAFRDVEIQGKIVRVQVWDTGGQERYRCITNAYYRRAAGVVVVYDIGNRRSFESVPRWVAEAREKTEPNVPILILANKSDLMARQVSRDEGRQQAAKLDLQLFETSALDAFNVDESFESLAKELLKREVLQTGGEVVEEGRRSGNCCK